MAMTVKEQIQEIFERRGFLVPIPDDLAPLGAHVRMVNGQIGRIDAWLGTDPEEASKVGNQRLALVAIVEGAISDHGAKAMDDSLPQELWPEDKVTLVRRPKQPPLVKRNPREHLQ